MNLLDNNSSLTSEEKKKSDIEKNNKNSTTNSSPNTIKSSNASAIPPKVQKLLNELSKALKQVKAERDELLQNGRKTDQEMIQTLLSKISELKTTMSELQKTNQSLAINNDELRKDNGLKLRSEQEQIESELHEAQGQLDKQKKAYESKITDLKDTHAQEIKVLKDQCKEIETRSAKDNKEAAKKLAEAEGYKKEQQRLMYEQQGYINQAAQRITANEVARLNNEYSVAIVNSQKHYENLYLAREGFHAFVMVFSIALVLIQAILSSLIRHNIAELGEFLLRAVQAHWSFVASSLEWVMDTVQDLISNEIGATILGIIAFLIVAIVLLAILFPLVPALAGLLTYKYLKSECFDSVMKWIAILSGITCVALSSDLLRDSDINLVFLWLLIQPSAVIIRYIIWPLILEVLVPYIEDKVTHYKHMSYVDQQQVKRNVFFVFMMIGLVIGGFLMMKYLVLMPLAEALSS